MDQDVTWCGGTPRARQPGTPPIFDPCPLWQNGWMDQMSLGTEVGLVTGNIALDRDPAPHRKGHGSPHFCPCLLWPNGWADQDVTWYGGRSRHRRHCIKGGPSSPIERGTAAPTFWPMSIVAKRSPISATAELLLFWSLFLLLFYNGSWACY